MVTVDWNTTTGLTGLPRRQCQRARHRLPTSQTWSPVSDARPTSPATAMHGATRGDRRYVATGDDARPAAHRQLSALWTPAAAGDEEARRGAPGRLDAWPEATAGGLVLDDQDLAVAPRRCGCAVRLYAYPCGLVPLEENTSKDSLRWL
ncbi:hypothetical_protein [Leishmania braziliensis MHOM/BR/75/M2904]|uniref:Hypothetical_protein n=1 Tax=Leishmania braziliensis MHOM/BR/75/M2904 TaxID=420245 RepID=A0A3P3ZCM1_LEIBR|nr:unnamed protein product [Leishmania braziliensis]CAJ2477165.1 unnamed protein product [Leishmania braziliensis]SYZ67962.1 hypothetical_protein [Leishmania braziliensis MHOM/BR/75/M2904]SYZ67964.1 hypothetical_protein [Leishmania braziliensis MHOM/BR/75/M2904]